MIWHRRGTPRDVTAPSRQTRRIRIALLNEDATLVDTDSQAGPARTFPCARVAGILSALFAGATEVVDVVIEEHGGAFFAGTIYPAEAARYCRLDGLPQPRPLVIETDP